MKVVSMDPRKQRRKKYSKGKLMTVDSCESVNSEKRSADLEQLAHKYMQQCSIESSTDSESDANTEVLSHGALPGGPHQKTTDTKLQFLDPYDGDYEEISGSTDCSLDSFADACPKWEVFWKQPIPEGLTMEENFPAEHQEPLSAPPYWAVSVAVSDDSDHMKRTDNLMLMETETKEDRKGLPSGFCQVPELCKTAGVLQLTTELSPFMEREPSRGSRFSDNAVPASLLCSTGRLRDKGACEDPIIKRKQGQPLLECAGEKLSKKLRAT